MKHRGRASGAGHRSVLGAALILCAMLLVPVGLAAQQKPSKAPAADSLQTPDVEEMMGMMGQMAPMYESMTRAMVEGTLKAMVEPENIERMALFSRRYFDALVKQGFTPGQALQIVAGVGMPAARLGR